MTSVGCGVVVYTILDPFELSERASIDSLTGECRGLKTMHCRPVPEFMADRPNAISRSTETKVKFSRGEALEAVGFAKRSWEAGREDDVEFLRLEWFLGHVVLNALLVHTLFDCRHCSAHVRGLQPPPSVNLPLKTGTCSGKPCSLSDSPIFHRLCHFRDANSVTK